MPESKAGGGEGVGLLQGSVGRMAANMRWGRDGGSRDAGPGIVHWSYRPALLYGPDLDTEARKGSPSGGSALSLYR